MIPHQDPQGTISLKCVVITVSDTRTRANDSSGKLIQTLLTTAKHEIVGYEIVPDEPVMIERQLQQWQSQQVDVVIVNGGTGIAKRDRTLEAISRHLEKTLPGFGELFRFLSYQSIGSRAMASRAIAGVSGQTLIFSLPGSSNGVKLAMEELIIPELVHLNRQLQQ